MVQSLLTSSSKPASAPWRDGEAAVVDRAVEELVRTNPHQLSAREYHYVAKVVARQAAAGGCRLLVFGVGLDSPLWLWVNRRGRTVFLESSRSWALQMLERIPSLALYPVRYGTRRSDWRRLLAGDPAPLLLDLPDPVRDTPWNVIFVDAPQGWGDKSPGRMRSIYTAAELGRRSGAEVLVHDCDRRVERAYCDRFLGAERLVRELHRTRHYRFPRSQAAAGAER